MLLVRHRVLAGEAAGALAAPIAPRTVARAAVQLGAQPIDFGLERTGVDLEERIAAPDDRAFLEANRGRRSPDTRGRTATEFTASRRPVNSSHSVTSCGTTLATVTFEGGGSPG